MKIRKDDLKGQKIADFLREISKICMKLLHLKAFMPLTLMHCDRLTLHSGPLGKAMNYLDAEH